MSEPQEVQDIVDELNTELGIVDDSQFEGFDIEEQAEKAKIEDEGIPVHIDGANGLPMFYKDASGQLRPVTITVCGTNSTRYRRAEELQRKRKIRAVKLTGEKLHEDQLEKVVACVTDFDGFFVKKQRVDFSPGNVRMILKKCKWILDQLTEAMNDHERFTSRA